MSFKGIRLFVFLITGKYVNFLPLCILGFFKKGPHDLFDTGLLSCVRIAFWCLSRDCLLDSAC